MSGITLDSGALIAVERGDRFVLRALARAKETDERITVPAGVIAQVWRDGSRQAVLSRLLKSRQVSIEPLDEARAKAAGALCGASGTSDVIDASVVICARAHGHTVITSDPKDLARLDPLLPLRAI
jgi:hypothetical protein